MTKNKESLRDLVNDPHCEVLRTKPGFADRVVMRGHLRAVLRGPDGKIKQVEETHNLVTDNGDTYVANLLYAQTYGTAGGMGSFKLGSASTAAAKTSTNAGAFITTADYISGSFTAIDTIEEGDTADEVNFIHLFDAGEATGTIRRIALVANNETDAGDGDGSTTMAIAVFDADIPKGASDTLTVTWGITFAGA